MHRIVLHAPYNVVLVIQLDAIFLTERIDHYFQDVCVPIHGSCSTESAPDFYINGHPTIWPNSEGQLYNVTLHSQKYYFCFKNITEDVVITEYCHHDHLAGCSLCSTQNGEVIYQSRSEIFISLPSKTLL